MIYIAMSYSGREIIQQAGLIMPALFADLTAIVFITKKDFLFFRIAIVAGCFVALGLMVAGAVFNFNFEVWFSVVMAVLVIGSVLYQTS